MATIKGKWLFNSSIDLKDISQTVNFTSNGSSFTSFYADASALAYKSVHIYMVYISSSYNGKGWSQISTNYRYVDFGSDTQTVSDEFYTWFTANAKPDVTDLTGYTVTVPSGWSATAGYGRFAIFYDGSAHYEYDDVVGGKGLTVFNVGYDYYNVPSDDSIFYGEMDWSFAEIGTLNLQIYGGTDVTNTSLIQWFIDNNATFEKTSEEPEEPDLITDLSNTTWYIPSGWSVPSGYGNYYDYGVETSGVTSTLGSDKWHSFNLGYEFIDSDGYYQPSADKIGFFNDNYSIFANIGVLTSFSITFPDDFRYSTDESLISWLSQYGELQIEEPEEPDQPTTPTKKFTRLYIGDIVASSGVRCFRKLTIEQPHDDELQGTWVFNDILKGSIDSRVNFKDINGNWTRMEFDGTFFYYYNTENPENSYLVPVYEEFWRVDPIITITSKLSEVTNGEALLTWLKANATKQDTAIGTFTHKHTGALTNSTTYEFEVGMTWAEWVDSEYNSRGVARIDDNDDVKWNAGAGGIYDYLYKDSVVCKSTDEIIEGAIYTSVYYENGTND